MAKKRSELLQTLVFAIIALGNLFLASRYWSRDDMVGMAIFVVVVILAGAAAIGHALEYCKTKRGK